MGSLRIVKVSSSVARFLRDSELYLGSSYDVWCEAAEFRRDADAPAVLSVESDDEVFASCNLAPDPQRRGVRRGTLSLAGLSEPSGRCWLCAKLAGDVVFRVEVVVFRTAPGSPGGTSGQ